MTYGEYTPLAPGDFEYGRLGKVTSGAQPLLGLSRLAQWSRIHSWTLYINTVKEIPMAMEIIGIGFGKDNTDDSSLELKDILFIVLPDRTRRSATNFKAWSTIHGSDRTGRVKEIVTYACPEDVAGENISIDDGLELVHDGSHIVTRYKDVLYGELPWEEMNGQYLKLWSSIPDGGKYAYGINSIKEFDEKVYDDDGALLDIGERHYKLDPRVDASQVLFLSYSGLYNIDFSLFVEPQAFYNNITGLPAPNHPIWETGATILTDEQLRLMSTYTGTMNFSAGDPYSLYQSFFLRFDYPGLAFLEDLAPVSDMGELIWELYIPINYKLILSNMENAQAILVVYLEKEITINGIVVAEPGWYPLYIPEATEQADYYLTNTGSYIMDNIRARVLGTVVGSSQTLYFGIWVRGMSDLGLTDVDGDKVLVKEFVDAPMIPYPTISNAMQGQTFTLSQDMYLESIKVFVKNKYGNLDAEFYITIWDTSGGVPTGSAIVGGSYTTLESTDTEYTWLEVDDMEDLNNPGQKYKLLSGHTYAIVAFTGGTLVTADWAGTTGNKFAGGTRVYKSGGTWYTDSTSDLLFKLYGLIDVIKGYGVAFAGAGAKVYASVPNNSSLKPTLSEQLCWSANVRLDEKVDTRYLYMSDGGVSSKGFIIIVNSTDLLFRIYHEDASITTLTYPHDSLDIGTIYNIEFRVINEGIARQIELYIDGVYIKSEVLASLSDIDYTTNAGYLGWDGGSNYFDGIISDLKIYKAGTLISYWPMKEGTGTTLYDSEDVQDLTLHVQTPYTLWTNNVPWGEPRSMELSIQEFTPWIKLYNKEYAKTRVVTKAEKAYYDYKEGNFILSTTPKVITGIYLMNPDTNAKIEPNMISMLTRTEGEEFELPMHNLHARLEPKTIWKWRGFNKLYPNLNWPFIQYTYHITVDDKNIPHSIDAGAYIKKVGYIWVEYITESEDDTLLPSPRDVFSPAQTVLRYLTKDGTDSELYVTCASGAPDYTLNTFIPWGMKVDVEYNMLPTGSIPVMRNRAISGRVDQGICLHPEVDMNVVVEGDIVTGSSGKGAIRGLGSRDALPSYRVHLLSNAKFV